ncbi:MAG TPA: alanine--tRNA ligase [Burkholderiaceae bacterium]|nr:alanine--tRNA ligase [Burkholderiaceae bacterium]
MKTSEIRQKFLSFFESRGHQVVPSSSLVPANDPTLLFTNAGMVQFKDVFTGKETRPYKRAVSSQRCVRAGGKHNDLENVGYTARHHTFFEMLGNFSFGDYFKREAIAYSWELLTQVFGLPAEKLWVTVYHEDDEAYNIWANDIGVPTERIIRIGDDEGGRYSSDNFWQMADTGPCGPCSEVFYDHGPEIWGGPPGSPDEDGDRYIEIWNLVFMQYDRAADGTMTPLPKPCVDTGMGLERVAAVLQNVHSNYEIDLFQALIRGAARETGVTDLGNDSLKVIADHIRACGFLIVDGVIPGNEGRGYVLRRIIRRALRHGYKLGQKGLFFHKLVPDLIEQMGQAYPELVAQQERIAQVLRQEEERFSATLEHGMAILDGALADIKPGGTLDGQTLFTLYDTYGFPVDLTADICRERQVNVDLDGFDAAMERQREQARAAGKFKEAENVTYSGVSTQFTGYEQLQTSGRITALYLDGTQVNTLEAGQEGIVVLDTTPFYAESGGQVGDTGVLTADGVQFDVNDTRKIQSQVFGHYGTVRTGTLSVGDTVTASVDVARRTDTIRNHSATHLMHHALRQVLGQHVQQRGSLVDAERTRFDFAHDAPLTAEQIAEVERLVNAEILANHDVAVRNMPYEEAVEGGAMALFGEKYDDVVRVLDIGFSRELCGGTHVQRTGDIGLFKIISESGVAAGVRRVEAITGNRAFQWMVNTHNTLQQAASLVKAQPATLVERIEALQGQLRTLERERDQLRSKLDSARGSELIDQAIALPGDAKLLVAAVDGVDPKGLRAMADQAKDKLKSAVVMLASVLDGRVNLVAGVTHDLTDQIKAGELVGMVARQVGGKGGGRPDMAMGGGTSAQDLPAALDSTKDWVLQRLSA